MGCLWTLVQGGQCSFARTRRACRSWHGNLACTAAVHTAAHPHSPRDTSCRAQAPTECSAPSFPQLHVALLQPTGASDIITASPRCTTTPWILSAAASLSCMHRTVLAPCGQSPATHALPGVHAAAYCRAVASAAATTAWPLLPPLCRQQRRLALALAAAVAATAVVRHYNLQVAAAVAAARAAAAAATPAAVQQRSC